MAITRCPYCHAIIDEQDKYCNNCGTQLLFADDEAVEEEIPGEKIIDAEVEEKDYTIDEPEDEKRPAAAKDLDDEIEKELDEDGEAPPPAALVDGQSEEDEAVEPTEEVILVDEIEAAEAAAAGEKDPGQPGDLDDEDDEDDEDEEEDDEESEDRKDGQIDEVEDEKKETGTAGLEADGNRGTIPIELDEEIEEELEEELEPPPASGRTPDVEYVEEVTPPDESSTAGEASLRPATFDTKELENLGRTVELSKEKVDRFIEGRAEAAASAGPPADTPAPAPVSFAPPASIGPEPEDGPGSEPVPGPEPAGIAAEGPAIIPPTGSAEPPTGSLPPWASTMKGAPVFPDDTGPVETRKFRGGEPGPSGTEEEIEIFPRRRVSDSTMGLPEEVSQAPLPFEAPAPEADESGDLELAEEEEQEAESEEEEAGPEGPGTPDQALEAAILPAGEVRAGREPLLPRTPAPAGAGRQAAEPAEEAEEPEPRPPFSFSVFFKSKVFDVLFVGLFWVVALWLAAGTMGRTLFEVLGSMSGPMLLLYAAFLFLYFFLFEFFLGETIGDRLFRRRE